MPTPTDLVTDLPADFEVFGQAVDTSMADLLGGTTGQILAKNSNTNMDFVWIANDQGDITGITATSPLTGGGTSGAVTVGIQDATTAQKGAVQLEDSTSSTSTTTAAVPASVKSAYDLANAAIPKSLLDAAGDVIYATANDTPARLALGTAGQVLTVNSGATAPEWATPAGGGKILQVVQATYSTETTSTSTSFADTGLTASITPSSASNTILVMISQPFFHSRLGNGSGGGVRLMRGASQIFTADNSYTAGRIGAGGTTSVEGGSYISFSYIDSPATTSSTTYKTQFRVYQAANSGTIAAQSGSVGASIILMEIGA
jgi:hypothetical protein